MPFFSRLVDHIDVDNFVDSMGTQNDLLRSVVEVEERLASLSRLVGHTEMDKLVDSMVMRNDHRFPSFLEDLLHVRGFVGVAFGDFFVSLIATFDYHTSYWVWYFENSERSHPL